METISTILALLCVMAFMAMLIGLIRPTLVIRWGEKRTRGRVLLYYGLGLIVLSILGPAMEPEEVKVERAEKNLEKGTRLLSVARTAYNAQNYQTAVDSANEAISTLKSVKQYISEATVLTDRAQAFLDSAKAANDSVESAKNLEKGTRLLLVARRAYDAHNYQTATDAANEAINALKSAKLHISEATVLTDRAQAFLDSAEVVAKHFSIVEKYFRLAFRNVDSTTVNIRFNRISAGYTVDVAYDEHWEKRKSSSSIVSARFLLLMGTLQFMGTVFVDSACSAVQKVILRPHTRFADNLGNALPKTQSGELSLDREVAEKINWSFFIDNFMENPYRFQRLLQTEGHLWIHDVYNRN